MKYMKFIDIIEEKLVGRRINIRNITTIEVEEKSGIHFIKNEDIKDDFALVAEVYSIFDYNDFIVGVHAVADGKLLVFTFCDTDDIVFDVKEEL